MRWYAACREAEAEAWVSRERWQLGVPAARSARRRSGSGGCGRSSNGSASARYAAARPAPRPRPAPPSPPAPRPQVSRILRKAAAERSAEEGRLLAESEDLVTELQGRSRRREGLKRRQEEASPAARPGLGRCGVRSAHSPGRASRRAGAGLTTGLGVSAGVRRPGGAAEESPGAGRRRPERQVPGGLHRRWDQHGKAAGRGRPRPRLGSLADRRRRGRTWGAPFWVTHPRTERVPLSVGTDSLKTHLTNSPAVRSSSYLFIF